MSFRKILFPCVLILAGVSFVVFANLAALSHGQDRPVVPVAAPTPLNGTPRGTSLPAAPAGSADRVLRDLSRLPPLQHQMYLSAQRGADWLCRTNQADGRFLHGY